MRIQITLTVHEAKRIIAKGIAELPAVKAALETGSIFLKETPRFPPFVKSSQVTP